MKKQGKHWGLETVERAKRGEMAALFDLRRLAKALGVPVADRIDTASDLKATAERVETVMRKRETAMLTREQEEAEAAAADEPDSPDMKTIIEELCRWDPLESTGSDRVFHLRVDGRGVIVRGKPIQFRIGKGGRLPYRLGIDGSRLTCDVGLTALAVYLMWRQSLTVEDVQYLKSAGLGALWPELAS
jgi:hypothetical protein